MSQPTWNKSHWALVIVVVLLLGLVAVKHTTARQSARTSARVAPTEAHATVLNSTAPGPPQPGREPAAQPASASEIEAAKKTGEPLPGSEFDKSLQSGRPTVADFGAGWCQACKKMVPVLAEAVAKYQGKVNIVFVNTDEYPSVARGYRISAIPTQVFFDANGKEVGRHVGYYPIEDFDAQAKSLGLVR
jgi:thioredoxin 1